MSKFTIAPIGKVHSQVLFWKHFNFFQVLKFMVCFHEEKNADASSATSGTLFPCFSRTLNKE
jgi:hypothetical protein